MFIVEIYHCLNKYICQQFEKALSKVGITKYHHLTGEEVRNTRDIVAMLRWVLVSIEM